MSSDTQSQNRHGTRDTLGWFCCQIVSPVATFVCIQGKSNANSSAGSQIAVLGHPFPTQYRSKCHKSFPLSVELKMQVPFPFRAPQYILFRVASVARCRVDLGNIFRTTHIIHRAHTDMSRTSDKIHSWSGMDRALWWSLRCGDSSIHFDAGVVHHFPRLDDYVADWHSQRQRRIWAER